jgi:hypothetical protein
MLSQEASINYEEHATVWPTAATSFQAACAYYSGDQSSSSPAPKWVKSFVFLIIHGVIAVVVYTAFALSTTMGIIFTSLLTVCILIVLITPWCCRTCTYSSSVVESDCSHLNTTNYSDDAKVTYKMSVKADDDDPVVDEDGNQLACQVFAAKASNYQEAKTDSEHPTEAAAEKKELYSNV